MLLLRGFNDEAQIGVSTSPVPENGANPADGLVRVPYTLPAEIVAARLDANYQTLWRYQLPLPSGSSVDEYHVAHQVRELADGSGRWWVRARCNGSTGFTG